MGTAPYYVTGTGNVGPATGGSLHSVTLVGGSDAATVTLREGGSGGSIIVVVKAPTVETRQVVFKDMVYTGQLHATFAGTGPVATIEL